MAENIPVISIKNHKIEIIVSFLSAMEDNCNKRAELAGKLRQDFAERPDQYINKAYDLLPGMYRPDTH